LITPIPPKCRCFGRKSSISDVSSTPGSYATTPSGKCSLSSSLRGIVNPFGFRSPSLLLLSRYRASFRKPGAFQNLGESSLTMLELQASSPIYHPQHNPARADEGRGAAAANPNALLHATNTDPEPVYHGWKKSRCPCRLQDDAGRCSLSQLKALLSVWTNLRF
jgi:hypothetical protein